MVRELRPVVTAEDDDEALGFHRDVLGLEEREPYSAPWSSLNARLRAPAGLQPTLFQELG